MLLDKRLEENIKRNHYYFLKLDKDIREDKDFVLYLLCLNTDIYFLLDERLSKNTEIISKVVFLKFEIINDFSNDILLDEKISKEIFKLDPLAHQVYSSKNILDKVQINSLPNHIFNYLARLEKHN